MKKKLKQTTKSTNKSNIEKLKEQNKRNY